MWPLKLDMSRDECKKCLRCLELDAYGNMVSVLRAQGSFTCEKQKLLQELAKVLHISNERHRAEIRRAVNDEKLTTIAEQFERRAHRRGDFFAFIEPIEAHRLPSLAKSITPSIIIDIDLLDMLQNRLSGPNTGTNWAIEGRRMIPLLPRMKACTVYTGLANSLSLVTSAANEKKPSTNRERINDVKVKVEAESRTELELEEKSPPSISPSASQPEGRFNNRKRKRSLLEASDNEGSSIIALSNGERNKVETIAISTSRVESNSPTPMSVPPPDKVVIVSPPSEANVDRHSRGSVMNTSRFTTSASHHQNLTVVSLGNSSIGSSSTVSPISVTSQSSMYGHSPIQPSRHLGTTVNTYATATAKTKPTAVTAQSKANPRTAIDLPSSSTQYADEKNPVYEAHEAQQSSDKCGKIVSISNDTRRASSRCENKVANHNSSCTRRVTSVTHSSTKSSKSLSLSNGPRVMTMISSNSTASSGPGPPHIATNPTVLTCKKLPAAKLNHQSTAKMGITLNSNKTLNVTPNASARLATKTNVIVVQKGHTRGVTLSHAGKEVLGKVIMGGKNFCLSNQQNASSVSLLPHRVAANGDQACMTMLSSLSSSQSESVRSHSKSGNMIVFDLRPDDVAEKSKFLSQFLEASGVFNSESKAGTLKPNSQLLTKESGKINNSPTIGKYTQSKDNATGDTVTEQHEHRCNKKDPADTAVKEMDEALSIESVDSRGTPDGSHVPSERQGVLDPQTGIYSFQSSDNAMNSMEIEGPISNTEIDIFSTALASADINLENFEYAEDEESSNNVMEEARNQILNIDRLNELYE